MMLKARSPLNNGRGPQGSVKQVLIRRKALLIIYGPTQTGKTNLALQLARKFQGELISADSRQVYKGLDIGAGKVAFDDVVEKHVGYWTVNRIKINGFDLANPGQQFSAVDFLKFAQSLIRRIIDKKKLPIVVGGTGFYIKSLLEGIGSIGIPADWELRTRLGKLPSNDLYKQLFSINPVRAKSLNQSDRVNPRRLIRAIEITTHKKYQVSSIKYKENTKYQIPNTKYLFVGLTAPNEFLFKKADRWLEERISHGLIEEVKNLLSMGVDGNWLKNLGLEYRWITKYLTGENSYEESLLRLKGDIHSFVRRQKSWVKKFKGIRLFDISDKNYQASIEKTVCLWYTKENERRKNIT